MNQDLVKFFILFSIFLMIFLGYKIFTGENAKTEDTKKIFIFIILGIFLIITIFYG